MTRRARAACAFALAGALTGCAGGADEAAAAGLTGQSWQIVALHTDPAAPGALPPDAAGKATLEFGAASMRGLTGCAPLRATTTAEGALLRLDEVEVADPGDCIGGSRYVHDQLVGLFAAGTTFQVRHLGQREALLRKEGVAPGAEAPSLRMMAL